MARDPDDNPSPRDEPAQRRPIPRPRPASLPIGAYRERGKVYIDECRAKIDEAEVPG